MGLLSDPNYGSSKWLTVVRKIYYPLCFLCYVVAIVWFVMLGRREFNNETYFSENALLPGLVTNEFNAEQSAKQFYNEFLQELEDKYSDTDEMPVPWLVAKMSQLHLEVYTHNFTLHSPLGGGQVFRGTNVYGILRSARAAPLEALLLSAPFRPRRSHLKPTAAGVALMLSFAQFARPQKYWAKDIIFLVTCHEQLGMQAWLEAYHGLRSEPGTFYTSLGPFLAPVTSHQPAPARFLDPGTLKGRSGAIQAAINLELHTPKIKYVEVKIEGLNGQLPNLDLPNLVHKLCVKSGLHHSFKNSYSWIRSRQPNEDWKQSFLTMMKMVGAQISGAPSGNHGLCRRFGVEAVTIEGRDAADHDAAPRANTLQAANFYRLGIALESIFRSLNNLLERFHQSYFFYLMAAINRFVSIGQYMPSLCLLIAAMLIKSLALWVKIQGLPEDNESQSESEKTPDDKDADGTPKKSAKECKKSDNKGLEKTSKVSGKSSELPGKSPEEKKAKKRVTFAVDEKEESMSIVNIGINYLIVHFVGYAMMNSPALFSYIGSTKGLSSELSVYYGFLASFAVTTIFAPILLKHLRTAPNNSNEMILLNVLVLIELATICLCIGMHNVSLGLFVGVIYVPLALLAGVSTGGSKWSKLKTNLTRLLCLAVHPLVLSTAVCSVLAQQYWSEPQSLSSGLSKGAAAAAQLLMHTYVDSAIFGNWLFNVLCTLVLPVWTIFWQLLCNKVAE